MKESDWKKFKAIKQQALEAYCSKTLVEAQRIIANSSTSSHEAYIALYGHIQQSDKKLAYAFDDHSRSRATIQLMLLRKMALVSNAELSKLTTEIQESTKP